MQPKPLKDRLELLDVIGLEEKVCAEIGVLRGEFSAEILARNPKELFLIDPWLSQPRGEYSDFQNYKEPLFNEIEKETRDRFRDDTRVRIFKLFSHEGAAIFEARMFDFVFIDGNHDFCHCYMDLCMWSMLVKPGGWIGVHDYQKTCFIGVTQAVNAFARITEQPIQYVTQEDWGSAAIQIK